MFTTRRIATFRGKELQVRTTLLNLFETLKTASRKLGPYVLLEVLLPGGTLFALALFVYRRQGGGDLLSQALATAATLLARVRARFGARTQPHATPQRSLTAS
jgi:hypothetical protein